MSRIPRVLVVEDEQDIAALIKHALERSGQVQVDIVASGDAALRAAAESQPDLVVLDLNLPILSGTEVCRVLRAQPATAHIPIIMLTARTSESDRVAGLDLGASAIASSSSGRALIVTRRHAQQSKSGPYQMLSCLRISRHESPNTSRCINASRKSLRR